LFEKLLKLYDEVHEILLKLHGESEPYYAVSIYWDEIKPILGQGLTATIFQDIVQEMNEAGLTFENLSWDTLKKDEMPYGNYKDVIAFRSKMRKTIFTNYYYVLWTKTPINFLQHLLAFIVKVSFQILSLIQNLGSAMFVNIGRMRTIFLSMKKGTPLFVISGILVVNK